MYLRDGVEPFLFFNLAHVLTCLSELIGGKQTRNNAAEIS
jgi:hypothetical protein